MRGELYYPPTEYQDILHYNEYVQAYLYIGTLLILGIAILFNVLGRIASHLRRSQSKKWMGLTRPSARCSRSGKGCTKWVPGTILASIRKASCRKSRFASFFGMSSLGEVAVIALYTILNIVLVLVGASGKWDYMAHHAARLANANLPLVIGLASKNNVISHATGYSYESLNVYHRWIARIFIFHATFHSAGRIYTNFPIIDFNGVPPLGDPKGYLYAGTIGYFAFLFMVLLAVRPIRRMFYQFFIVTHVILFIVGCVTVCYHRPTVAPWIYAGLVIYFLDRIVRTARIFINHGYRAVKSSDLLDFEEVAVVEVLSDDTIKVTVKTSLNWNSGQHIYIHFPLISAGGHPFTVASIDRDVKQIDEAILPISTIVLLIRVRKGLTRKLFNLAMGDLESTVASSEKLPRTAILSTVWCEGGYGNLIHLDYYQSLLLVAGGSGVSFTLSLLLDLVRRRRAMHLGFGGNAIATERLTFVWIVRKTEQLEWIGDSLREVMELAPPGFLQILLYVTAPDSPLTNSISSTTVKDSSEKLEPPPKLITVTRAESIASIHSERTRINDSRPALPFRVGRPNLKEILEEEIERTDFSDYFGVATCGPVKMTSDLAEIVSDAIDIGKVLRGEHRRNIRFHCEEYGW